ncbi:MAG TPA: HAD family phosphatase [Acidisarcina sp.]
MSAISTVLWDVGGVLLTNGWDHVGRAAVVAHFGLDRGEFERRHAIVNDPWERGVISAAEYMSEAVFHQPRSFTPAEFLEQMKAESQVLPDGGLGVLVRMAESSGLQLAILNNEARELNDYRLQQFNLTPFFECFLSSCYVGLRKPDPKIYQRGLDILQRSAGEVVFIDDRAENVAPAAALGMHGIQFRNPAQLCSELALLGINI